MGETLAPALEGRILRDYRTVLVGLVIARMALGGLALLVVPIFYEDHFLWVASVRPTKEVLLAGGFLVRGGDLFVLPLLVVALPLLVGGVWLSYFLGLSYKDDFADDELPGLAGKLLHRPKVHGLAEALRESGWRLVFFGRLAAFPSSVLAMAAGTSDMDRRTFLLADLAGAVVSLVGVIGLGYLLGEAYEQAGVWLTALGVVILVGCAILFGHLLQKRS